MAWRYNGKVEYCLELAPNHIQHLAGLLLHIAGTRTLLSILFFTPKAVRSVTLYQDALRPALLQINPTKKKTQEEVFFLLL